MDSNAHNPEHLRSLDQMHKPDPRANEQVRFDLKTRGLRPVALEDHHADIAQFTLFSTVPQKVVTHFETAKNLYLYAWHVYRFYPVADLHVRGTLELALKERIGAGNLRQALKSVNKRPGLNGYILYAIQQEWVKNEGFKRWRESGRMRAEERARRELIEDMDRKGLNEAFFDPSKVEITDEDNGWDLIALLADSLPQIRNEYAHGSDMLHNQVLGTFQLVAEFINQLWPESGGIEVG